MASHIVAEATSITPGMVATAGPGDTILVHRSATRRHDWAAISQAAMTAYARGAAVTLAGGATL